MGRQCEVCGKKTTAGNNVSHSHLKTKRRWKPNLQHVKVTVNGTVTHKWVCTRCLKGNKVLKAV